MAIITANPWGLANNDSPQFNVQRSDLWEINLDEVLDIVLNPVGVTPGQEYLALAAAAGTLQPEIYAQKVTLPEILIDGFEVTQGSHKRKLPGKDLPATVTRIDFIQEASGAWLSNKNSSALYCVLKCWQLLSLAGQQRDGEVNLPLTSASSKPSYKASVGVTLLRGASGDMTGSPARIELDDGARYRLTDCWLSDLQVPDMDAAQGANPAIITATIQVEALLPATE